MHGTAIRRFFVAFIRPRLEYCCAVWCGASPALLKDLEKAQLRVAKAIVRNPSLQDVSTLRQARLPSFVVAKARALPWRSSAAVYWERSSCITGLTGALCTATVHSLSSLVLLSFSFCFIVSPLVVLTLSNCLHLEQVAFFCHLFYVSLFFSVSDSTQLCFGYVQPWSLLVLFSDSFSRLPHFYLYFCVYVPTSSFVPCFLLLFLSFFMCVVVVSFSQRKGPR